MISELGIGILNSIFGVVLIAFWKRALSIYTLKRWCTSMVVPPHEQKFAQPIAVYLITLLQEEYICHKGLSLATNTLSFGYTL